MARKILGWVVLAFVLFYAISNPHTAAHHVHTIASGVGTFFSALVGGGN